MEELTQELVRNLFEYKDGELYWKVNLNRSIKIGSKSGTLDNTGYYHIGINNKTYLTHRLIFLYHKGFLPKYLDHIDRNPLNNDIENLREVTHQENLMNQESHKNSSSIYKGVTWDKSRNKWKAQITINKKLKHLGRFINEQDAALTYNKAAIKYFEEHAYLNEV